MSHPSHVRTGSGSRAIAAAALAVVLWASAYVFIRRGTGSFSPGAFAFGRLFVGSAVLGTVMVVKRAGLPPRAAWPGIVIAGMTWSGLYTVALNWGERSVDAGTAAMIVNAAPVVIAVLSRWLLKEELTRTLLAGMAVSFAGAAMVGIANAGGKTSSLSGVLLCFVAALCYSVGVVAQKPALRHASALQVTTYTTIVGTLFCLPFAGQLVTQVTQAPAPSVLTIGYLGAFSTALGSLAWAYALARNTAGKLAATTYAIPAAAVAMSWMLLDEAPHWLAAAGGVLCVAGVAVSRWTRHR